MQDNRVWLVAISENRLAERQGLAFEIKSVYNKIIPVNWIHPTTPCPETLRHSKLCPLLNQVEPSRAMQAQ